MTLPLDIEHAANIALELIRATGRLITMAQHGLATGEDYARVKAACDAFDAWRDGPGRELYNEWKEGWGREI